MAQQGDPSPSKREEVSGPPERTLEEKLMIIEREIHTLHQFCLNQGYTPRDVQDAAKPILAWVWEEKKKYFMRGLWKGAILVAILASLFYYDPAYRMICAYSKRASMQILPIWDWTKLYGDDCLIYNPYYRGNELTEEDCELCETIDVIERVSNVSRAQISEALKQDMPLIITDGTKDWPAMERFNVHFLHDLYDKEPALQQAKTCYFACNVRNRVGMVRQLLRGAVMGQYDRWYAHWENCDPGAAKFLRQFFPRPYFMPPMVEMANTNWIFVSQNYKAKKYKPADIAHSMAILAQVKGETKINLQPREPCNEVCAYLYATLKEGEMVIFTDMMWILDYLPLGSPQSILVGVGGFFD